MNEHIRTLIIEKSIDFIKLISHCLYSSKKNNFAIDFYNNSAEGLQACLTNAYDVIFIGSETENESGLSFLKNVIDYGCKTPIIFFDNNDQLHQDAMNIGAFDFLIKNEINVNILDRSILYVTELGKARYDAEHDKLTNLKNRNAFLEILEKTIEKSQHDSQFTYGLLFIDVDGFKYVNDSLGHIIGDKLLVAISHKIKSCLHSLDTLARYGGDEFAILLTGMSKETIVLYANRIKDLFNTSLFVDGYEFNNTISVGAVIAQGNNYSTPQEIIKDADIAMYYNKHKDKDKPIFFDLNMRQKLERRYSIENKLRKAIQKNEFQIQYQPILSLKDNKILSLEALLRWKNEDTFIPPDEFIPIAEELFLIHNITEIVLKKVIRDMKQWKFPYFISVSVNISPKQISNTSIVDMFKNELKNIEKERLVIEITESSLINGNRKSCEENLKKFKQEGFKIHLDDFGTGYSALGHIIHFPLNGIKIDKSFIISIENNPVTTSVVKTIINLAHSLGMYVIAEGVETEERAEILKQLNCDYAQGYYYYRPMYSQDVLKLFNLLSNQPEIKNP